MNPRDTRHYYRDNPGARLAVLLSVCLASFLTPLSLSASLIAIPAIAEDLQADAVLVSWIPAAFLLSNMVMLLPAGRWADCFGRKRVYLIGTLVFIIGTLGAGLSPNIETLLFFRILQGVGAGTLFSNGMAILTTVYRSGGRGGALGIMVSSVYIGLASGPLYGGWLSDQFGWRMVFLAMVPLSLLAMLISLFRMKGEWVSDTPNKIDWRGTLLLALWAPLLFTGLADLLHLKGQLMAAAGLALLVVFIRHLLTADTPLVRLRVVWGNRLFSRSLLASMFMYGGYYGFVFLLGLYMQYNMGMPATEAGQMIMVQTAVMAVLAPLTGRLSDRWSSRGLATAGCLITALGFVVLQLSLGQSPAVILIPLVITGIGFGFFSTPNNSGALGAVEESRLGAASALVNWSRLIGQMAGTALIALFIAIHIGEQQMGPTDADALSVVLSWSLAFSTLFALAAGVFSWSRGKATGSSAQ